MSHRTIVLCTAFLVSGCNEILGLGGDFTVTGLVGGDGAGAGGEPQGGQPPSGGSPATGGGGTGAEGGMGEGGGEPVEATCDEYCGIITAHCTNANVEYPTNTCPVICAYMTKGHVGDTAGDTVGCRITKAELAEDDPVTYCQQAGPLGADGCAEDPCDSFCTLAFATCTPSEQVPFASFNECLQECALQDYLRLDEGGSDLNTTSGDSLNCWLYHLQVANFGLPSTAGHCNHFSGPGDQCL